MVVVMMVMRGGGGGISLWLYSMALHEECTRFWIPTLDRVHPVLRPNPLKRRAMYLKLEVERTLGSLTPTQLQPPRSWAAP